MAQALSKAVAVLGFLGIVRARLPRSAVAWVLACIYYFFGAHRQRKLMKKGTSWPMSMLQSGKTPVWYPFFGNVWVIPHILRQRLTFGLENARENDFENGELCFPNNVNIVTLTNEPDLKYMLKTNWKNYQKNFDRSRGFDVAFKEVMGRGIFAVDAEEWREQRKTAAHLFSAHALAEKMEAVFVEHSGRLVELLRDKAATDEVFDLQNIFASFTFDTMCEIAFGMNPGATEVAADGGKLDFLISFDAAQGTCADRLANLPFVWKLQRFLGLGTEGDLPGHIRVLRDYIMPVVRKRKAELKAATAAGGTPKTTRGDLLSMFIAAGAKKKDPALRATLLTDAHLLDVVLNFMIAGRDTTSCLLTNLFMCLSFNPKRETTLAQELACALPFDELITGKTEARGRGALALFNTCIEGTPFATACFQETLRLFPPVGADLRFCIQDDVLPSGMQIRAGTTCGVPNYIIGRSPNIYGADAEEFVPERWYDEKTGSVKRIHRTHEYVQPVFWAGPRLCLGKDMAKFEAKLVMAMILGSGLRLRVEPGQKGIAVASNAGGHEFVKGPVIFHKHGVMVRAKDQRVAAPYSEERGRGEEASVSVIDVSRRAS